MLLRNVDKTINGAKIILNINAMIRTLFLAKSSSDRNQDDTIILFASEPGWLVWLGSYCGFKTRLK